MILDRLQKWFVRGAAVVLIFAAVGKLWSATGTSRLLMQTDPVFGVPFRAVMVVSAIIELIVACICVFNRKALLGTALIGWLATGFLTYRLGLWWVGWNRPCSCLGALTDAIHMSPDVADAIVKGVLGCLLTGSYGLLYQEWRRSQRDVLGGCGLRRTDGKAVGGGQAGA